MKSLKQSRNLCPTLWVVHAGDGHDEKLQEYIISFATFPIGYGSIEHNVTKLVSEVRLNSTPTESTVVGRQVWINIKNRVVILKFGSSNFKIILQVNATLTVLFVILRQQ